MSGDTSPTTLTADGRTLAWCEYGAPAAAPALLGDASDGTSV